MSIATPFICQLKGSSTFHLAALVLCKLKLPLVNTVFFPNISKPILKHQSDVFARYLH